MTETSSDGNRCVSIDLDTPRIGELPAVIGELRNWQDDAGPMQLHPGDLGWAAKEGEQALGASLRIWRRDGRIVAIALIDGPTVLRVTTAPDVRHDAPLASALVADLDAPARGVLPAGEVSVEAPNGSALQAALTSAGWGLGMPWVALRRDLAGLVEDPGCRVETVGPTMVPVQTATHRAAWNTQTFTDARWHAMAAGTAYADACSLVAFDDDGQAAATLIVWSAGPGRPGLIEPLGTRPEYRRRGYGRGLVLAAARWLQEGGSSSISVCTMASLTGATATYEHAGMVREPDRLDRLRPG